MMFIYDMEALITQQ